MKILFDSHTHINNDTYSEEERAQLIADIEASDVAYAMDIGFDLASSERAVSDAALLPWCYAAVGVHPHDTKTMTEEIYEKLRHLAGQPKVQAIGEIGLDFYYNHSDAEDQRYWFRRQIQLANALRMPIAIHAREADQETMDILKEEGAFSDERCSWFPLRPGTGVGRKADAGARQKKTCAGQSGAYGSAETTFGTVQVGACAEAAETDVLRNAMMNDAKESGRVGANDCTGRCCMEKDARVLLHCFSGSRELAEQYVKLGATISIAGPVTYKNNRKTSEVVSAIPIEYLLVETDAPYLTPEPYRGKKNKSPYVEYTARRVALLKGMPYEEVARRTLENAKRFYGIE